MRPNKTCLFFKYSLSLSLIHIKLMMKKSSLVYLFKLQNIYLLGVTALFLICQPYCEAVIKLPPGKVIPAVIGFGDSIIDTGNNNNLKSVVKCNFPPYGRDFNGGIPTGRFGNGLVPTDLIVQELGIKELLPAYTDPNLKPEELPTGACFASGGSGFDPMTPKIVSVISLSDQLRMFEEYKGKLKSMVGKDKTNFILENALFLVVAGSDDIANTYFTVGARRLQYDVSSYTDLMLNNALDFINKLYALGARRIGVFSAPPIGCVPSQRTLGGGLHRQCAKDYNAAAKLFNSKLVHKLNFLTNQLPNSKIIYIDVYKPLFQIIVNPKKYGFTVVNKGCCGTGTIEVAILCNPALPTCTNASNHVFWDSFHPTEATYRVLVTQIIGKYLYRFF